MKNIEIEIQVNIENSNPLLVFLEKNAEFKAENHQIDEYFTPEYRDFIKTKPIEEWLRLRDSGGRYSINYKKWHYAEDGKGYHADEYETKLEDLDQIKKILEVLNFKPIVTVDKLRKTWIYKDYEVDIDSVRGLGDFVEIEYVGREVNLDSKKPPQVW